MLYGWVLQHVLAISFVSFINNYNVFPCISLIQSTMSSNSYFEFGTESSERRPTFTPPPQDFPRQTSNTCAGKAKVALFAWLGRLRQTTGISFSDAGFAHWSTDERAAYPFSFFVANMTGNVRFWPFSSSFSILETQHLCRYQCVHVWIYRCTRD